MDTTAPATPPAGRHAGAALLAAAWRQTNGVLDALQAPVALATRLYVAWQFLKSGQLKLASWENTLFLFREEYRVPLISPELAAVAGTAGEIVFPLLLIAGAAGRVSALGLLAVNVMAVVAYAHVLLTPGFEAAVAQHVLWGFMLVVLAVYGPGPWSADRLLAARRRQGTAAGGATAAVAG